MAEAPSTSTTSRIPNQRTTIQSGDLVLVKLLNGNLRSVKIEPNTTISIGRMGAFHASELIGQPYGVSYEIIDKKLKVMPARLIEELEDTDATNELINDGEFVQPLTVEEIETLKKSGAHASDIIKKQIEQHANYSLKTEYSKEKYKKRKENKYLKCFTTVPPTLFNVCEYWFAKDQDRIRDFRIDSLSQALNMANIHPGGRYIAVDEASGMLVTGILERMAGQGRLITVCDVDSPPAYPVLQHMNFEPGVAVPMSTLNWWTVREDYVSPLDTRKDPGATQNDRQEQRVNKRKATFQNLQQLREELFVGGFDALLIASEYDPQSILDKLFPYVAGSGNIVIHSPYLSVLSDLQARMRNQSCFLGPSITESFLRRYQVLPGRTHPTMNTSGGGGFLLHAIKVYDNPQTSSVDALHEELRRSKRQKTDADDADRAEPEIDDKDDATPSDVQTSGLPQASNTEDGSNKMIVDSAGEDINNPL